MTDNKTTEKTVHLPITGMTCANCAANIERSVKKINGIGDVMVNFANEQAKVSYDPKQVNLDTLVKNVKKAGYDVAGAHVDLPITGMTCTNCSATVERTLNKKNRRDRQRLGQLRNRTGIGGLSARRGQPRGDRGRHRKSRLRRRYSR